MKVGVVIPVYNGIKYIGECLASINRQTYTNVQAYIADDISDDGTYEWLLDNPRLYGRLKRNETRLGWPGNTNSAAALAIEDGCDAIMLMAADDYLRDDAIQVMVLCMKAGNLDWTVPWIKQVGTVRGDIMCSQPNPTLADFKTWPPLVDKAMFRSDVWQTVGGYSDDVTIEGNWGGAEDWELWIKVFKAGYTNFFVIDDPLYFYRVHDEQLNSTRASIHEQAVELIKKKHPDVWELPGGWGVEPNFE